MNSRKNPRNRPGHKQVWPIFKQKHSRIFHVSRDLRLRLYILAIRLCAYVSLHALLNVRLNDSHHIQHSVAYGSHFRIFFLITNLLLSILLAAIFFTILRVLQKQRIFYNPRPTSVQINLRIQQFVFPKEEKRVSNSCCPFQRKYIWHVCRKGNLKTHKTSKSV